MLGLSFGKIIVLAIIVIAAWRLFRWLEGRASANLPGHGCKPPPPLPEEKAGEVELEQDPKTGVWRPRQPD